MDDIETIAIVGLAGRFPGAKTIAEFWRNLCNGVESISLLSEEEIIADGADPALVRQPNYIKARGVLGDTELMDAAFFGLHPREAALMDPQHRLFIECAWEALEDAGYNPEDYKGRIGVFGGQSMNTYLLNNVYAHIENVQSVESLQASIGNDKDSLTTEVAYRMNLTGPAVTIQSSSSTSLVAAHYACQSLLTYESDLALAGGVSIHFPEKAGYLYYPGGTSSSDGHSRPFDARADGFVAGHGAGIVVLKRLSEAIRDGDTIYAVIKGSAVNNDGSVKVSYMAPSVDGQARVIAMAQAVAGVKPEAVGYVEAHGTGTLVGDPIEVAALTQAFRSAANRKGFCALGSVKPNIGHLDSAAGIAGLIKTALVLKHKLLPPTLFYEQPNPNIDFANSPFFVNTRLTEWKTNGTPRLAGVSSFGMGGTNAHAVLGEPPTPQPSGPSRPARLLLFSAKTESALDAMTARLAEALRDQPGLNLADVAFTLQVGRKRLGHRRMLVCHSPEDAQTALSARDPERVFTSYQEPHSRSVNFMFSGQGAQYVDMGRGLYETETVFRETVDTCAKLLKPHLELDVREVLYPASGQSEAAAEKLTQTGLTQAALFTIEYAMARLWISWGIKPQAMIGHSIGEYVAACLAGVFSLEDALMLVAARGRLMQQMPAGSMLAVSLSEQKIQPFLGGQLSLAAINGPATCVVSGPTEAIDALQSRLEKDGAQCRRLHTSHAFHSVMMEPILGQFRQELQRVRFNPPALTYLSNVTGDWITAAEATNPDYWVTHLRQAVRFADGVHKLLQDPDAILLEVGPGQTLNTLAKLQMDRNGQQEALSSLRHPNDSRSDLDFLLNTVGRLWLGGVSIAWTAFYAGEQRHRIPLPTYPFERLRHWIEPKEQSPVKESASRPGKQDVADWFYCPSWKQTLSFPPVEKGALADQQACWLLFLPDGANELAARFAQRLNLEFQDVVTIYPGASFTQLGSQHFTICPQKPADYEAVLKALGQTGRVPARIIHFWNAPGLKTASFEQIQDLGFYSLLYLVQALDGQKIAAPVQMTVVTSSAQQVVDTEIVRPEKATILGVCKVIPQEYTNITCKNIDVELPIPDSWREARLVEQLLSECVTENRKDRVITYRGQQRWTQTFEALRLDRDALTKSGLRKQGVYLVTGGLGNVGFALAQALAKNAHARLILVGRSIPPERELWADWLATHDEQDVTSAKIRMIQSLEQLGAQVMVASADVSNRAQMQYVVDQAQARFGAIHGVIHAAGTVGQALFKAVKETGPLDAQAHFAAKVKGVQVLEDVFRGQELDFCLLTSSLASILGGLGLAAYAAANSFMDTFAYRHNQLGSVPWISVNWDAWQLTSRQYSTSGNPFGDVAITVEEGADVFQRILSLPRGAVAQVAVSTTGLQTRLEQWTTREEAPKSVDTSSYSPRPTLATAYVAPRNEIEWEIAQIWQATLGIQKVGVYDSFFELGGNSLVGVQLISNLKEKWAVQIPVVSLYEGPTVNALGKIITQLVVPDAEEQTTNEPSRARGQKLREKRRRKAQDTQGDVENE